MDFRIIETMLMQGEIRHRQLHMERMERSARYFHFPFPASAIGDELSRAVAGLDGGRHRVRMLLDKSGEVHITYTPLQEMTEPPAIALSSFRTDSANPFLYHKTTERKLYDDERARANAAGFYDVLFINEKGEVTEGAITNMYCRQNGILYTPPAACGLLEGTMRKHLMDQGMVQEKILRREDLEKSEGLLISNSIIGLRETAGKGYTRRYLTDAPLANSLMFLTISSIRSGWERVTASPFMSVSMRFSS